MKLGFVSDSLGNLPFEEVLDRATELGVSGVEVNTGGWSSAPHFDLAAMKSDAAARRRFAAAFADRGLDIISLNANGNPLHPAQPEQGECLKDTIRIAGELGIRTVCAMSGLPAGREGDLMPNWVVALAPRNAGHPALSVGGKAAALLGRDRRSGARKRGGTDRP
ncbi:sugar phosphate isomerase/epimerase family protein [Paenirhodobacter populi]|uniref:sugar phosphate isomerase/epimerase family protein n=1 Tax=Paenirhodobacter populi TaxID=2306993 RepID=UPI001F500D11|nr:TIM barrel protein [Sinirhodobacter populi]